MPNAYEAMNDAELKAAIADLEKQADDLRALDLKLDMARGKPSPQQTALSRPMLDLLGSESDLSDEGVAADNYGCPEGLPSARRLAAELLGVDEKNVIVNGSSSLNLMHDVVCNAYTHGIGGNKPWSQQGKVKFLCPAPGYDRHFTVTARYGIENVPVPMTAEGPDMDIVRRYVEEDPSVKGIWCVPMYANPTGITYSDEVVRAFAHLKPAAPDFRIFWDNAYCVHTFKGEGDHLLNIFDALEEAGAADLVYEFGSTAKVTFPSSGMAYMTASPADMAEVRAAFASMRVSPEKISQLALPQGRRRRACPHGEARGHRRTALRPCGGEAHPGPGRPGRGNLDAPLRRLLRLLRRSRGLCQGHREPRRRAGRQAHPGRRHLALRQGPQGHQHPHRADLPHP